MKYRNALYNNTFSVLGFTKVYNHKKQTKIQTKQQKWPVVYIKILMIKISKQYQHKVGSSLSQCGQNHCLVNLCHYSGQLKLVDGNWEISKWGRTYEKKTQKKKTLSLSFADRS